MLFESIEKMYADAKALAEKSNQQLSIDHFWFVADKTFCAADFERTKDLPRKDQGSAPKTMEGLAARAADYVRFDRAIAQFGVPGDPDVDASIKRIKLYEAENERRTGQWSMQDVVRFACLTNLLFLGREVFNKAFTFSTHARICNFFVQKDSTKPIEEQDETKERLLLYPRGGFKSTIDVIDCVQWIINFPDVRILILAAATDLATSFIGELKNYFTAPKGTTPTIFQMLFPAWVLDPNDEGPGDEFTCPCRTQGDEKKKDATAWAASILSNLPGWHCDVMKADDTVNDKNSETAQLIQKVNDKIDFAESLIDPGGYKDLLGTPYAPADLYSHTVESSENGDLKLVKVPAKWLKPDSVNKDPKALGPDDWFLLFEYDKFGRQRLTYDFLRKKERKNRAIHNSQYMLDPAGIKKVSFPQALLLQRTIDRTQLPEKLVYYIVWDFAYSKNKKSDYSVGAVVGLDEDGRAYIVEIFRDRYVESDLAMEIARSFVAYRPMLVPVENSNGAQFLETSIRRYAEDMGEKYIPLDFFKVDNAFGAKTLRIGALEPLLREGQLFFLNTIACLDDLYQEFREFGSSSHDDIPDAISHMQRILPTRRSQPTPPATPEQQALEKKFAMRDFYDMIHGDGDYYQPAPVEKPIESPTSSPIDEAGEIIDYYGIPGVGR